MRTFKRSTFKRSFSLSQGCEALMLVTERNEFKHLDWERVGAVMAQPNLFDGRNIYDPEEMKRMGFH